MPKKLTQTEEQLSDDLYEAMNTWQGLSFSNRGDLLMQDYLAQYLHAKGYCKSSETLKRVGERLSKNISCTYSEDKIWHCVSKHFIESLKQGVMPEE